MTAMCAQFKLPALRECRAHGLWGDLALTTIGQPFTQRASAMLRPVSLRFLGIGTARTHDKGGAITVDHSNEATPHQGL
jgi:hypothetical protein